MNTLNHEYNVPPEKLVPGMVLSRNLVSRGTVLLRYNTVLDSELIDRIKQLGVDQVEVYLRDTDIELMKSMVLTADTIPDRDVFVKGIQKLVGHDNPTWANPANICRDLQFIPIIDEVLQHIAEICTQSSRAFELLVETRFLTHPHLIHCRLATVYALCIGVELDYNVPALIELGLCGMFFDVGKLKITFEYLNKPAKLTEIEFAQVKKHTYFGRQMVLKLSESFPALKRVALEHHENYYGGGYPRNIRGNDIHPFSQIIALADKFSAMLTPKDYRGSYMPHEVYTKLIEQTRTSVAPHVFRAFTQSILVYPRNCYLKLSNGAIARIVHSMPERPLHPVIELVYSENGQSYVGHRPQVDLSTRPNLLITGITQYAQY